MPNYKLKNGGILTEQELALYAEELGLTPEQYLEEKSFLFEDPTAPKPRRFIRYKGVDIFEDEYNPPKNDSRYPPTFDEYAKLTNRPIVTQEAAVDLGTTKIAEGSLTQQASDINTRAREASLAVTEDTVKDKFAETYFKLDEFENQISDERGFLGRAKDFTLGMLGAGPYAYDDPEDDTEKLKKFLGEEDYTRYLDWKNNGKFDANLLSKKERERILNQEKSSARQLVYREDGTFGGNENAALETARTLLIDDGQNIKAQQRKDFRDFEAMYGAPLVRIETMNGRTFVPPSVSVLDDPRYKAAQEFKNQKLKEQINQIETDITDYESEVAAFNLDYEKLNTKFENNETVTPEEVNALLVNQERLISIQKELEYQSQNLDIVLKEKSEKDLIFLDLAKNYAGIDRLSLILEQSYLGSAAMIGSKFLEYGARAAEGTADFFNIESLQLKFQETLKSAQSQTSSAVNYNEKLQNQLEYNFPKALSIDDESSFGTWFADALINNSPSILISAATLGTGTVAQGAYLAASRLGAAAFFVMESGGKMADMEITQKNAPIIIANLEEKLELATTDRERAQIKREIAHYTDALNYTELQKGFTGLYYGGTAALAELLGNSFLFKNVGKMGRSYGTNFLKKYTNEAAANIIGKGIGIARATGGGIAIEELEETLTSVAHNLNDIVVLGENKSLVDGINLDFFANVAVSSLAIQGGSIASNVQRAVLSEITNSQERSVFNNLQKEFIDIRTKLADTNITAEERLDLLEKQRAVNKKAAELLTTTYQKLSRMGNEEIELLFETNRQARSIRRTVQEIVDSEGVEKTDYAKNRLNSLQNEYNELMGTRDQLISKAQAKQENEYRANLAEYMAAISEQQGKFKENLRDIVWSPEVQYNYSKFDLARTIIKNIDGVTYIKLTKERDLQLKRDNPDHIVGSNAVVVGNKIYVNEALIAGTIANGGLDAAIAAVSPMHELGHTRVAQTGILKDKNLQKNSQKIVQEFREYTQQQLNINKITQKEFDFIMDRLDRYKEVGGGQVDIDEVFQLINDLTNIGIFKSSSFSGLASIKQFINGILQKFLGDSSHLFSVNNISQARAFVASYAESRAKVQLPDDKTKSKASLNVGPMSDKQLEKVKESLQKLGRDENGVFKKEKYDPRSIEIFEALPGMIYVQAQKRAIKGLQFDMEELISETTYRLLKENENGKSDLSRYDGRGTLYGYLNGRINWRIKDAFIANPSIVTNFGEASMEDLTQQFSQEESDDTVSRQEAEAASSPISPGMPNRVSFSKALDKMMPGLINNEVKQVFYNALEKFLQTKDQLKGFRTARLDWQKSEAGQATNEKGEKLFVDVLGKVITQSKKETLPILERDKYKALMNQELTLQPEEAKFLREIIAEFLEKEITKYLRLEVIANPADKTGRFKRLVESSFDLYKIIPQEFLNSRIKNWIEPDLHTEGPDKGKQKRADTLSAGKYGGAKGNPLYKRIKLTEQEWNDYWLAPGKGAPTRGKLKERFAILIAQEYGKDLMLEFLNDQEKLDLFLAQQKLPSSNQIDNLGMAMTVALERDPGAFKLKYSINASDAPLVLQAMPELVEATNNALLRKRFTIENLVEEFKQIFKDSEINPEAIEGLAKYFTSSFKKRKRILRIKQEKGEISKLNKEEESLAMQEAMAYYIFGNYGGFVSKFTKDKNQINSLYGSGKGKDWKLNENKIYDLTNQQHAIGAINYLIENEGYTIFEIWDVLGASLNSGTYLTVFSNNQDFYNAFENQFEAEGITFNGRDFIKDGKKLRRTTQNINGPKVALAFNTNANDAANEYNKNAEQARKDLEKLIVAFENRLKKAEDSEQEQIILHQAAILFGSMQTASKSTGRKIAKVSHYEAGLNAKNALFEHSTPIGLIMGLIGDRLNKKITKEQFNKFIEEKATAVVLDSKTTDKILSVFFKNNLPMDIDIIKDNYNQLARYMHSLVARDLKGKVLIGVDGNKTIEFDKLPHAQSADQVAKGKPSLNTTRNLTMIPRYNDKEEITGWKSEMFRVMSGPYEYYYELYPMVGWDAIELGLDIAADENVTTQDFLALTFSRYDTDMDEDSTYMTGNFAEEERNPIKVFSIIGNSVLDFMKKQGKYKGLLFSADAEEKSRVKLYDRFAKMIADKFGYKVVIQDITGPGSGELFYRRYYVVDPAYTENGKIINPKPASKYSLNGMSKDFNLIIEDKFGIEEYKRFSQIVGKRRGAKIDKFNVKQWFFPPSAEDFMGLMYDLLGKGEKGDAQMQWFVDNIVLPYTDGIAQIDAARQSIKRTYRNLLTENKGIRKLLQQKTPDGDYTYDQALRVWLWNKQGEEIPGLSERDRNKLVELINSSQELQDFANVLLSLPNMEKGYPKPSEYWDAETLLSDLNGLTEKTNRKVFLSKFIENIDIIFSEQNKNKLRAALGNNWVEALEDILYRMENGTNRPSGSNRIVNAWNNWVNRSIGAIMFFNRRSAVLQLLSTVNFINWSDNNPVKAAAAFANQKQYWKDFVYIFNSDKLKERRGGLRTDVSEAEIANAAERSKGDPGAILSYLLKIGFTLTQIADSFAIASGGATFYRNRIKTYVKEGMTQKEAEAKAWSDFSRISDETQQSSDPMLISQEQASVLGRLILAFQNTSAQYTRRGRKGIRNIINGRGDFKTELSVSLYYLAIQNIIFNSLQNALFTFIPGFDGEDEDEELTDKELERKQQKESSTWARAINGTLDTVLRGAGLRGAVVATLKNTIMKFYEQEQKDPFFKDNAQIVLEALNLSPPIGSKARKFYNALRTRDFEKDVIEERGWDLFIDGKFKPSPVYSVVGNIAAAVANVPLDRAYDEVVSISEAFDARNTAAQRAALALGYKSWAVGAKQEEEDLIKERAKALRKEQGIEKAKATRKRNKQKADSIQNALELEMMKKLPLDEYLQWLKSETYKKKKKKKNK